MRRKACARFWRSARPSTMESSGESSGARSNAESALLVERHERVALLTLNRPTVMNAFNEELIQSLTNALRDAERDAGVGAVVITGSGRAFCAGQDLQSRRAIFERGEVPHLGAG